MNPRTMFPLGIALILGLIAAISAKSLMSKGPATPQTGDMKPVVVANKPLPAGSLLKADDLTIARASAEMASDAVFADRAMLVGRVTVDKLVKGQPIVESVLAPAGVGEGLQALVPDGMRAITLEVNEFTGLAGFLVPGCHVDVVATVRGDDGELTSRTVVQNLRVQAVGQRTQGINDPAPGEQVRSITLLGTPRESEAIDLSAASGRVRLVLRGGADSKVSPVAGVTLAELRGGGAGAAAQAQLSSGHPTTQPVAIDWAQIGRGRMRVVQVYRGGVEQDVTMAEPADSRMTETGTGNATGAQ